MSSSKRASDFSQRMMLARDGARATDRGNPNFVEPARKRQRYRRDALCHTISVCVTVAPPQSCFHALSRDGVVYWTYVEWRF